jgi:hypothetical protein
VVRSNLPGFKVEHLPRSCSEILDKRIERPKISEIREPALESLATVRTMNFQNPSISNPPSAQKPMEKICRHPRVRVVAREEDAEFVECQECGDVFEASEFRDMAIEETIKPEEV